MTQNSATTQHSATTQYDELFLFLAGGTPPDGDRIGHPASPSTLLAWVPNAESAALLAAELAGQGATLIELYRGFDLASAGRVMEAVDGRTPVGVAGFGFAGSAPGAPIADSVTIFDSGPVGPALDRVVREHPDGSRTTVLASPSAQVTVTEATHLVDAGADLIEICGGTPLSTAAAVARAVDGRATISLVSWPFESIEGAAAYKAAFEAAAAS